MRRRNIHRFSRILWIFNSNERKTRAPLINRGALISLQEVPIPYATRKMDKEWETVTGRRGNWRNPCGNLFSPSFRIEIRFQVIWSLCGMYVREERQRVGIERQREREKEGENVETIVRRIARREGGTGFPASSSAFLPFKINYQNVPSFFFYLLPWLNTSTFRY